MFVNSPKDFIYFDFNEKNAKRDDNGKQATYRYTYTFKQPKKVYCDINKLYTIKLNENYTPIKNKKILNEDARFTLPMTDSELRKLIQAQYKPCESEPDPLKNGCIGQINTDDCKTNVGIIGGDYIEQKYGGTGNWSLINRWDANDNIHKLIAKIYKRDTKKVLGSISTDWLETNAFDLFSNNGKYTSELADKGIEYFKKGFESESSAKKIIQQVWNLDELNNNIDYKLYNNCGGSIDDTIYGQDIILELNGEKYFFQVKSFKDNEIKYYQDSDRGFYYGVESYKKHTSYKMDKVDIILYINTSKNQYILFRNDYRKIITTANLYYPPYIINYYEKPIATNMQFTLQNVDKPLPEKKLLSSNKENLIAFYKERLDFFKQKLKELGYSEDINEQIKTYKRKLIKLLTE